MSELQGPINVEHEIKFVTDAAGLKEGLTLLQASGLGSLGRYFFFRPHVYYDTTDFVLARNDWALRKRRNKFSYCLKYPVEAHPLVLSRREMFSRDLEFPLDIRNALHRRGPLLARVMGLLAEGVDEATLDQRVSSFEPRVMIECSRDYYFSTAANQCDHLFGAAFDHICAYDASTGQPLKTWNEIELETGWGYSESLREMISFGEKLQNAGFTSTQESKYKIAHYELACAGVAP